MQKSVCDLVDFENNIRKRARSELFFGFEHIVCERRDIIDKQNMQRPLLLLATEQLTLAHVVGGHRWRVRCCRRSQSRLLDYVTKLQVLRELQKCCVAFAFVRRDVVRAGCGESVRC